MKKIIVFTIALFVGSAFVYTQAQGKGKGKGREKQVTEQKQTQLEKATQDSLVTDQVLNEEEQTAAREQSKETERGNAFGRNKQGLSGREFGQQRAA